MNDLTQPAGIIALAAALLALAALVLGFALWRRSGRLRADQRAVLGEGDRDLVAHAAELQRQYEALHGWVVDVITRLEGRIDRTEGRLDRTIAHRAVVRYDAYNELSGRQSASIALLDAQRSGIVVSTIHHRDQAHFYVKQVERGEAAIPLSPEELEAVRAAMAAEVPDSQAPGEAPA